MTKTKPTPGQGRGSIQAMKYGMGVAMTTSVQVSERTLQLLNKLKQEEGLRSHDQVIRELISERRKIPRSMFGPTRDCGASQPRTRPSLTSFSHVIDSYAWIEYFKASVEGEKAKEFIEGEGSATPVIVVAEVSRKLLREVEAGKETGEQRRRHLEFIRSSSQIIHVDFDMGR